MNLKQVTKRIRLIQISTSIPKIPFSYKYRKAEIKNFRVLIFLQILTLIVAGIGVLTYLSQKECNDKGVVKGILYTGINSSVMIDNQILEEGDTIYGTTIEKIYPKKVEFTKNGKRWSQRICEHPNPEWTNTDKKYCSNNNK